MDAALLVRGARQLLTLRDSSGPRSGPETEDLGIIADGCLFIRNGVIEEAGPARRISNLLKVKRAVEIEAFGCVVLPCFVDPVANFGLLPQNEAALIHQARKLVRYGTVSIATTVPSNRSASLLRNAVERWMDVSFDTPRLNVISPTYSFLHSSSQSQSDNSRPFALATNFDGHKNSVCSMQTVIALACANNGMSCASAIVASTVNAAFAIGLLHKIGTLEPGKQADVLILEIPDYRRIPYHLGENLVRAVIKRGKVVYERRKAEWESPL